MGHSGQAQACAGVANNEGGRPTLEEVRAEARRSSLGLDGQTLIQPAACAAAAQPAAAPCWSLNQPTNRLASRSALCLAALLAAGQRFADGGHRGEVVGHKVCRPCHQEERQPAQRCRLVGLVIAIAIARGIVALAAAAAPAAPAAYLVRRVGGCLEGKTPRSRFCMCNTLETNPFMSAVQCKQGEHQEAKSSSVHSVTTWLRRGGAAGRPRSQQMGC